MVHLHKNHKQLLRSHSVYMMYMCIYRAAAKEIFFNKLKHTFLYVSSHKTIIWLHKIYNIVHKSYGQLLWCFLSLLMLDSPLSPFTYITWKTAAWTFDRICWTIPFKNHISTNQKILNTNAHPGPHILSKPKAPAGNNLLPTIQQKLHGL